MTGANRTDERTIGQELANARQLLESHGYYVSRRVAGKIDPPEPPPEGPPDWIEKGWPHRESDPEQLEPPPATPDVMDFGTISFDWLPRLFRWLFRRGR